MHDIVDLESRGTPGVFVASAEFVEASEVMGRALGLDPKKVLVPHPVQDRTDDEMRDMADAVVDEVMTALIAG